MGDTQSLQLFYRESQRKKCERKASPFLQQLNKCCECPTSFWIQLKRYEDGGFRYFFAHENKTLLDRSKLVCTKDDLAKLKDKLNKRDVIESCRRDRTITKMEVPQINKLESVCYFAQRRTYGLPGRCLARNSA